VNRLRPVPAAVSAGPVILAMTGKHDAREALARHGPAPADIKDKPNSGPEVQILAPHPAGTLPKGKL
jgi:hypothetical protein